MTQQDEFNQAVIDWIKAQDDYRKAVATNFEKVLRIDEQLLKTIDSILSYLIILTIVIAIFGFGIIYVLVR